MWLRIFLILSIAVVWGVNALYAIYVNYLKLLQYKKVQEYRNLKEENYRLAAEIYKTLNFENLYKYAKDNGFVPIKPYRVVDFYSYLKGKQLYDFYMYWFNDTRQAVAKKFGVSLKELIKYNRFMKWYVPPGKVLKIPVKFPLDGSK
jgi:poly(3-hydroxyalkanoate) synthetase